MGSSCWLYLIFSIFRTFRKNNFYSGNIIMKFLLCNRRSLYFLSFIFQICLVFSARMAFAVQPFDIAPFNNSSFGSSAATTAWKPAFGGTNNITVEDRNGDHVMVIPCNHPNQVRVDRCAYDFGFPTLDLSNFKEFSLDIKVPNPEAVSMITVYFESVADYAGVYAQTITVPRAGWQTLTFSVAKMGAGSAASSWSHITKIRISPWKGSSSVVTELEVRGFRAIPRSSIAVVQDSAEIYKQTSAVLNSAFIKNDIVSVADIESGYLTTATTAMIVLPYNTPLSAAAIAKLQSFVAAGGRLTAYGAIDPWLQTLLGVSTSNPVQNPQVSFQFADSIIANLPPLIKQAAQPLQVAAGYPAGDTTKHARVIAKWSDINGPTQYPAWIASDTGLYMSSQLLADIYDASNASNQWKMFVSLLSQYAPSVAAQASLDALADSQHVGKYSDIAAVINAGHANESQLTSIRAADLQAAIATGNASYASVLQARADANHILAIDLAKKLKSDLRNVYNLSQLPTPLSAKEFRGVWSHDGFGPYMTSGGWARAIPLLRDNGFNAVIVNVSGAGFADYNSSILPRSTNSKIYGDQLASVIQEAHAVGIKVHAWDVVWNLNGLNINQIEQKQWYDTLAAVDSTGVAKRMMGQAVQNSSGTWQVKPMLLTTNNNGENLGDGWISPCNLENRTFKKNALLEMATNYEIDGIHLDYIRANGESSLYEESCRIRFQSDTGIQVAAENWPAGVLVAQSYNKTEYDKWRSSVITSFTKEIHDALIPINDTKRHLGKPIVILSASVYPDAVYAKVQNAQDWPDWINKGIIDQLHPMNYTHDSAPYDQLAVFNEMVRKQNLIIANRIPFYPGIGIVTSMTSDAAIAQIVATRGDNPSSLATGGFTLYNFANVFADYYVSAFGQGVTSNIAAQVTPPVVRSQYFSYQEGIDGGNLLSVAQVNSFIAGRQPTATFIATKFNYGNDTAFYTDLGHGTNLQTFLCSDKVSLNTDPGESSDAILRMYATVNLAAGTYNFKVHGDDGYQIKIDGVVVALTDNIQAPTDRVHQSFNLSTSGPHSVEILYWDQGGQAVFKAELSSDAGNTYKVLQTY